MHSVGPDAPEGEKRKQSHQVKRRPAKGSPEVHAAFREVNKLKKRQKGGGWSLINRRSHTLLISTACFRPMEPNVFPLPSFSLLLAVT